MNKNKGRVMHLEDICFSYMNKFNEDEKVFHKNGNIYVEFENDSCALTKNDFINIT